MIELAATSLSLRAAQGRTATAECSGVSPIDFAGCCPFPGLRSRPSLRWRILNVVCNAVEISIRWRGDRRDCRAPRSYAAVADHNHKGWISRDVGTNAKAAKESLGGSGSETSEPVLGPARLCLRPLCAPIAEREQARHEAGASLHAYNVSGKHEEPDMSTTPARSEAAGETRERRGST